MAKNYRIFMLLLVWLVSNKNNYEALGRTQRQCPNFISSVCYRPAPVGSFNKYRRAKVIEGVDNKNFLGYLVDKTGAVKDVWKTYATQVENLMATKVAELKTLYPNAKIGYRGSLSNGTKFDKDVSGLKFDPKDWDVDAFIVDDVLAANPLFKNPKFRDGRLIVDILPKTILIEDLLKVKSGYRSSPTKLFTFAVWTTDGAGKHLCSQPHWHTARHSQLGTVGCLYQL